MNFHEAKELFKKSYLEAGLELFNEETKALRFNCKCLKTYDATSYKKDVKLRITEEDINEYIDSEEFRSTIENAPVECSICSPTYREQIIQPLTQKLPLGVEGFVFGNSSEEQLYVSISNASTQFINYFRFDKKYLQHCLTKMCSSIGISRSGVTDIRSLLYSPFTIRVCNMSEGNVESAIKHSSALIDSCLFTLAYSKDVSFALVNEWPSLTKREFSLIENFVGLYPAIQQPLPTVTYHSDLVRFYLLGTSSDIPDLQFLSFYQVLEYFFLKVSDEKLYDQLFRRLSDPNFRPTPFFLDRLIQDVIDHNKITDETEMLKNVLYKFIDKEEVIEFINMHETHFGEKWYTTQRELFGKNVVVSQHEDHIIGTIANRIKIIRNAIVHSSDRYERYPRHIPFSESTKIIECEIPLVKFLAEKVIIASAIPLD